MRANNLGPPPLSLSHSLPPSVALPLFLVTVYVPICSFLFSVLPRTYVPRNNQIRGYTIFLRFAVINCRDLSGNRERERGEREGRRESRFDNFIARA